ncbi:hypothetical protein ABZ921_05120 [Streptomyces atriruber]|uniref:Uncharacterized protein n=1 Tax=Streptomyces atriruber TaxID=545121 RepID=A0ABV3BG66_9ACTN
MDSKVWAASVAGRADADRECARQVPDSGMRVGTQVVEELELAHRDAVLCPGQLVHRVVRARLAARQRVEEREHRRSCRQIDTFHGM